MENKGISGKTKICGIIGDPIEHTMSPAMHNAAFQRLELDYWYLPFRVKKEGLGKAIDGMRALDIRGLNVTIPHKVTVIPLLDKVEPLANKIGAVNTIVNDDGVLTGYNTDATGFLEALLAQGVAPAGSRLVILGAGGASRAVTFVLAERGANLIILNRSLARAQELVQRVSSVAKNSIEALALNPENLAAVLEKTDVLINTTSVGMNPDIDETPVPAKLLKPSLVVFDIVYNPPKTRLLRDAESAGAKVIGGLDMLVWQGALAFKLWTGKEAPVKLMKREVMKALGYEN